MKRRVKEPTLEEMIALGIRMKQALLAYTSEHYDEELRRRISKLEGDDLERFAMVADDFIFGHRFEDGVSVVERFLLDPPKLTPLEREVVLGWRDPVIGMFRLEREEKECFVATNLVDELSYHLIPTRNANKIRGLTVDHDCLMSRILPLKDVWLLSGLQHIFPASAPEQAYDVAADLAWKHPSLFFRNPAHLASGIEAERKQGERFLEHFGARWIVDTPSRIEAAMREFLLPRLDARTKAMREWFKLPEPLFRAELVGLVCTPKGATKFIPEFDDFLFALEHPERVTGDSLRGMVLSYLDNSSANLAILDMFSELEPERLNALLALALTKPGLDWRVDRQALLKKYYPLALSAPSLPSILPLPRALLEGHHRNLLARQRLAQKNESSSAGSPRKRKASARPAEPRGQKGRDVLRSDSPGVLEGKQLSLVFGTGRGLAPPSSLTSELGTSATPDLEADSSKEGSVAPE